VKRRGPVLTKGTVRIGPFVDSAAGTLSYAVVLMVKLGL
jgi:hypothetical protein